VVGCALNFLFDFSKGYASLPAQVDLQPKQSAFSLDSLSDISYVGLHMRFGDSVLVREGGVANLQEKLTVALGCAADLAKQKSIWGKEHWIFFASDSVNARSEIRSLALHLYPQLKVLHGELPPVHAVKKSHTNPWSYWGDFLLLAKMRAYVGYPSPSGFSFVASQIGFLPFAHQQLVNRALECKGISGFLDPSIAGVV